MTLQPTEPHQPGLWAFSLLTRVMDSGKEVGKIKTYMQGAFKVLVRAQNSIYSNVSLM